MSSGGQPVWCEACGKGFPVRAVEEPLEGGAVRQLFRCPHCGHEYLIAVLSADGVRLRAELARLRAKAPNLGPRQRKRLDAILADYQAELTLPAVTEG